MACSFDGMLQAVLVLSSFITGAGQGKLTSRAAADSNGSTVEAASCTQYTAFGCRLYSQYQADVQ